MTNEEQIFKMLEGRIDTASNLLIECFELIYNAGYNEGIEKAAIVGSAKANECCYRSDGFEEGVAEAIRSLKK